jgi:hypothetical protein
MSNSKIYDFIIIGSGIAGLYSSYLIKKQSNLSYLILEQNKRAGGRIGTEPFYGQRVVRGAGIGRMVDRILLELMREFKLPIQQFTSQKTYSPAILDNSEEYPNSLDIMKTVRTLRQELKKQQNNNKQNNNKTKTFREFALPILGKEQYDKFLIMVGYIDYENTDIEEALYHYGFSDTAPNNKDFSVPWNNLIEGLVERVGIDNIKYNRKVTKITRETEKQPIYQIHTEIGNYLCKKVVLATTITSLRKLLPEYPIYREIEGQNYLRLYGKFSARSIPIIREAVKSYIIVTGVIQKIIPMNADKGIYMISYNDNGNAKFLKNRLENNEENREYYCRKIETAVNIKRGSLELLGIKGFYWDIGTHYYKPLDYSKYNTRKQFIKEAQHPEDNIYVVGEVVSRKQGWTEGALESVEAVF